MGIFAALGVASTGMTVTRKWMDAISDNIANANNATRTDETPFQARYVIAQAAAYGRPEGVKVASIALGSTEGRLVFEPSHPLADDDGIVKYPSVDMAAQLTALIMAQRGYQANAAVVDRSREAYSAALQIGRS